VSHELDVARQNHGKAVPHITNFEQRLARMKGADLTKSTEPFNLRRLETTEIRECCVSLVDMWLVTSVHVTALRVATVVSERRDAAEMLRQSAPLFPTAILPQRRCARQGQPTLAQGARSAWRPVLHLLPACGATAETFRSNSAWPRTRAHHAEEDAPLLADLP